MCHCREGTEFLQNSTKHFHPSLSDGFCRQCDSLCGSAPDNWTFSVLKRLPKFSVPEKTKDEDQKDMRPLVLHNFMLQWLGTLESWRLERNMSCTYTDGLQTKQCLSRTRPATSAYKPSLVDSKALKEAEWGEHKAKLMKELKKCHLRAGQLFTQIGEKVERMEAGYGVWFGDQSPGNFHTPGKYEYFAKLINSGDKNEKTNIFFHNFQAEWKILLIFNYF